MLLRRMIRRKKLIFTLDLKKLLELSKKQRYSLLNLSLTCFNTQITLFAVLVCIVIIFFYFFLLLFFLNFTMKKNHDLTIVFPSIERIILLREKRWKETKLIAINAIHSIDLRNSIIKKL